MRAIPQLTHSSSTRFLTLLVTVLSAVLVQIFLAQPATAAPDQVSLGLSTNFVEHQVIPMTAGQTNGPTMQLRVDNAGTQKAEVEFSSTAPNGITVNPTKTTATLEPTKGTAFDFGVSVAPSQAPGDYEVRVTAKQTNVGNGEGGIVFAPAVNATFVVKVSGESGSAHVRAVAKGTDTPVSGEITIGYNSPDGRPLVPVQTVTGSEMTATLAPGNYVAQFANQGQVQVDSPFAITANQNVSVTLEVDAIYFAMAAALPQPSSDNVVSAKLVASVNNKVREVTTPVTVKVNVQRDGNQIDTVELHRAPSLPLGLTEMSETYVPSAGWAAGTYTFEFQLVTQDYTVTTTADKPIVISGGFPWLWVLVGAAVIVVLVIIFARMSKSSGTKAASAEARSGNESE